MRVRACVFVYVFDFYLILFFELSFATTSRCWRLLHAVYCMTLFNYSGKKARDEGFTFRWHLSNIMPDSIFYGSIFQGITCLFVCLFVSFVCLLIRLLFFSSWGGNHCFSQMRRDEYSLLQVYYQWAWENLEL